MVPRSAATAAAGLAVLLVTGITAGTIAAGTATAAGSAPGAARPGGTCGAVAGARQLPGSNGVTPAAWTGAGLTVPACGPIPNDGGGRTAVYPYPGALRTPGYQCVEFSERYLYFRYGVTMNISTNGDQVAAHYAARYPGKFAVVANGTRGRSPVAGDVISLSEARGFNSSEGGHTAVVQASSVNQAGNGTVTIVEENAVPSGVQVLRVTNWTVRYSSRFPYIEWLVPRGAAGPGGTPPAPAPPASAPPSAPAAPPAATAAPGGSPDVFYYDASAGSLRWARWTGTAWQFTTLDGPGSVLAGHTSHHVGAVTSAVEPGGQPVAFYADATTGSLRVAWRAGGSWRFAALDGPGGTAAGHTAHQVGAAVSAVVVAGRPAVFYYDATTQSVRYAWQTGGAGSSWHAQTLDGPGSVLAQHTWHHVGSAISALVAGGRPEAYYYDTSAGALHRAWWTGTRWDFLTIDGSTSLLAGHTGDLAGSVVSAALLSGQRRVFYYDATAGSLRGAWLTGAGWRFQTLDGHGSALRGHTADRVGAAIGVTEMNGGAQVYYADGTAGSLRHAWMTGATWHFETLDGRGSAISGHGTDRLGPAVGVTEMTAGPQVYYADVTRRSLRHAWWTATGWHFETLDGAGSALSGHLTASVGTGVTAVLS